VRRAGMKKILLISIAVALVSLTLYVLVTAQAHA
jgi:hypothetical protein